MLSFLRDDKTTNRDAVVESVFLAVWLRRPADGDTGARDTLVSLADGDKFDLMFLFRLILNLMFFRK